MASPSATKDEVLVVSETLPLLNNTAVERQRVAKWRRGTKIAASCIAFVALFVAFTCILTRVTDRPSSLPEDGTKFTFMVVGDWGRGNRNQRKCAHQMNVVADGWKPEFVISTGDNFYPDGLSSVDDHLMTKAFTEMYSHPSLQVPWYAVLGNHDYGDGWKNDSIHAVCGMNCRSPKWQYTQLMQSRESRWSCQNGTRLMRFHDVVSVLFIDTTPMVTKYASRPWAQYEGGLKDQNVPAQLAQIQKLLRSEEFQSAKWRIVVGHHGVRSYGDHCAAGGFTDCAEMSFLLPWLEEAGVHMYMNGHDHDLQHIKFPNETTHFITTGAGSNVNDWDFIDMPTPHAEYLSVLQGFVAVAVADDKLTVNFFVYNLEYPAHQLVLAADTLKH